MSVGNDEFLFFMKPHGDLWFEFKLMNCSNKYFFSEAVCSAVGQMWPWGSQKNRKQIEYFIHPLLIDLGHAYVIFHSLFLSHTAGKYFGRITGLI